MRFIENDVRSNQSKIRAHFSLKYWQSGHKSWYDSYSWISLVFYIIILTCWNVPLAFIVFFPILSTIELSEKDPQICNSSSTQSSCLILYNVKWIHSKFVIDLYHWITSFCWAKRSQGWPPSQKWPQQLLSPSNTWFFRKSIRSLHKDW